MLAALVRAVVVVMRQESCQHPAYVPVARDEQMVQAFSAYGALWGSITSAAACVLGSA